MLAGPDLVPQFDQALSNVCCLLQAAGGKPTDIVRLTVYLTDMPAYRSSLHELGEVWRSHLGRHYPAMSVVGVAALVHPQAVVEVEATALLNPLPD
jgi:enamine deaminase RidA (YjgF/YER057c/UK114 family)